MANLKESRMTQWDGITEHMNAGDIDGANLRMDNFITTLQGEEVEPELNTFIKKLDNDYKRQVGVIEEAAKKVNPIEAATAVNRGMAEVDFWRTRELYNMLFKLCRKGNLLPI